MHETPTSPIAGTNNVATAVLTRNQSEVPSDEVDELEVDEPQWLHQHAILDNTPSTNITIMHKTSMSITCDSENILRILRQYTQYTNYRKYSEIVLSGYIHNLQNKIISIIPADIINICLSFYYQQQNKYIHLAYNLYTVIIATKTIHHFCGKELILMIKDNYLDKDNQNEHIHYICNQLLQFGFIKLVSYQTHFSSLLDKSETNSIFNASADYEYTLTQHAITAFEQYSNADSSLYCKYSKNRA